MGILDNSQVNFFTDCIFFTSECPPCLKENLTQAYGLDTHGPGSLFAGGGWKFTITFALQQKHYQRNVAISENNLNHNRTQCGTCVVYHWNNVQR